MAKARAPTQPRPPSFHTPTRAFALSADSASLSRSSFLWMQRSIAISIATFLIVFVCSLDISTVSDLLEFEILRFRRFVSGYLAVQAVQSQYFPQPIRVVSGQYGAPVTVQYRVVSQYGHPVMVVSCVDMSLPEAFQSHRSQCCFNVLSMQVPDKVVKDLVRNHGVEDGSFGVPFTKLHQLPS